MSSKSKNHIKNNKPMININSRYHQGFYKPINPKKYIGNLDNLIFRSSLEKKWFRFFDLHNSIVQWKCEETIVTYVSPLDGRSHRYYIDVYIKYINKKNVVKEALIEIKPLSQVSRPKIPKYKTKSFIHQVNTYLVNEAKWNQAKKVAVENDMDFKILTEKGFIEWNITK